MVPVRWLLACFRCLRACSGSNLRKETHTVLDKVLTSVLVIIVFLLEVSTNLPERLAVLVTFLATSLHVKIWLFNMGTNRQSTIMIFLETSCKQTLCPRAKGVWFTVAKPHCSSLTAARKSIQSLIWTIVDKNCLKITKSMYLF